MIPKGGSIYYFKTKIHGFLPIFIFTDMDQRRTYSFHCVNEATASTNFLPLKKTVIKRKKITCIS